MNNNICPGCMNHSIKDPCEHCGWSSENEETSTLHLEPGSILQGKYLIGKALGQGGFGITYLAKDTVLDVKLAIKEYLPQDLASRQMGQDQVSVFSKEGKGYFDDGLQKFLQEAKTLAKFEQHPNIVSVRDYFEANDTAYIVMSYIEGITLKEYVQSKGGKLEVDQAVPIMMPVLDALKAVHNEGILHRDISPDNIFITSTGQVILIDFGAARQSISDKGRSMSILLKPGYTPEEQYRSKGQQGPWTDLYAVGATLYRIITGKMPLESMDRMVEDELEQPSRLVKDISPELEETILKSMAVFGKDRYQTAEELIQELHKAVEEETPEVSEVVGDQIEQRELEKPMEKNITSNSETKTMKPWQIISIVVVTTVLAASIFTVFWINSNESDETKTPIGMADEETEIYIVDEASGAAVETGSSEVQRTNDYIVPASASRGLRQADILHLTAGELRLARNEIFARHGYIFDSEDLQQYFQQQEWYTPDPNYDGSLSEVEKNNAEWLLGMEDAWGNESPDFTGFVFPDSNLRKLSALEVGSLSESEIRLARNEIFARHGHVFQSEDLQRHFQQQPWYQPNPLYDGSLNEIETYNVELLMEIEESL